MPYKKIHSRFRLWFLTVIFISLFSCGADEKIAPYSASPQALSPCGAIDGYIPHILQFLRSNKFEPVAQFIEQELSYKKKAGPFISALFTIVKKTPAQEGILKSIQVVKQDALEQALVPLLAQILRYIAGEPPHLRAHYELLEVFSSVLNHCDKRAPLTLIETLLKLKIKTSACLPSQESCVFFTSVFFNRINQILLNKNLTTVLTQFKAEEALSEQALIAIYNQALEILATHNFQFSTLKQIIESQFLSLITDDDIQANTRDLLTILEQTIKQNPTLSNAISETVQCFKQQDKNNALPQMIYALITDPKIQFLQFFKALQGAFKIQEQAPLSLLVADIIYLINNNSAISQAISDVFVPMCSIEYTPKLIPTLLRMGEAGAMDDLKILLSRIDTGCEKQPLHQ